MADSCQIMEKKKTLWYCKVISLQLIIIKKKIKKNCSVGEKKPSMHSFCLVHTHSCVNLWDSMDYRQPGSTVYGVFQARILEFIAISFSRRSSQLRVQTQVSCTTDRFFAIWSTREALMHNLYVIKHIKNLAYFCYSVKTLI